jgi:hypothetical protein
MTSVAQGTLASGVTDIAVFTRRASIEPMRDYRSGRVSRTFGGKPPSLS